MMDTLLGPEAVDRVKTKEINQPQYFIGNIYTQQQVTLIFYKFVLKYEAT